MQNSDMNKYQEQNTTKKRKKKELTEEEKRLLEEKAELLSALAAYPVKDGTDAVLKQITDAQK